MNTPIASDPHDLIRGSIRESSRSSQTFGLNERASDRHCCYGLLSNSAAVVIGAMVVTMLLGPIAGVALGIT
jgi:uncharacterized membrane protein